MYQMMVSVTVKTVDTLLIQEHLTIVWELSKQLHVNLGQGAAAWCVGRYWHEREREHAKPAKN